MTARRLLLAALVATGLVPATVAAQSSQFGIRGLGLPGHAWSARTTGTAGAFAQFDGQSSENPASIGNLPTFTAVFTMLQDFRSTTNPAGSTTGRDTGFPHFAVAVPVARSGFAVGLSFSAYADRDFALASTDTLDIRGVRTPVFDTLTSLGGMSEIRVAVSKQVGGWILAVAGHGLTGSNRLSLARQFGDTLFQPGRQKSVLAYGGVGFSAGITGNIGKRIKAAAMVRADGTLRVDGDSVRVRDMKMPVTVGAALAWQPSPRLSLAASARRSTWSRSNDDLIANGGAGAENTFALSAGAELVTNATRSSEFPIRLGARYGTLPFLLPGVPQPKEYGVSAGTGFIFAYGRGGLDLSVERVWRSAGPAHTERVWIITTGVMVRP